jgi:hypothetical protein
VFIIAEKFCKKLPNLQIYTDTDSPRMKYACSILFNILLKIPYQLLPTGATNIPYILDKAPRIFYTNQSVEFGNNVCIKPSGFLSQKTINNINTHPVWKNGVPILFPTSENCNLGFDIFSATFFMASRYEEYLDYVPDAYGRFPERSSISGRFDFTKLPVIHIWADLLKNKMSIIYPHLKWQGHKATALFTYDIDVAYAYKGRSAWQKIKSIGKNVLTGNLPVIKQKFSTRFGKRFDPSDTYNIMENNPLQKIYFFLLAKKRTKYDRNINPESPLLQTLIKQLRSSTSITGIHPSYYSTEHPELITGEKNMLEAIVQQQIIHSRQHFLRFRLPETFRQLIAAGIKHDYSMQYPEMPGFRSGLCLPYPFFDVAANEVTGLTLHPGCIMETTFRDDLILPASKSLNWYLELWQQVKLFGGEFISIWHNDTLWEGLPGEHALAFRQVHNKLIEIITSDISHS